MKKAFLFIFLSATLISCAKIYYSADATVLASKQEVFAILPPVVSISAQKKVDAEAIKEQQRTESMNFQKEMYSWLLKRKMQGRIQQEIQPLETTNALLKEAGYPETPLTTGDLCELLNVNGLMTSNYQLSKPMSDGAAVAMAVLVGAYGSTNEVHANISIMDCSEKKLIWNFDHKYQGSLGSTPARLVDGIMRQASKKMPYTLPTY